MTQSADQSRLGRTVLVWALRIVLGMMFLYIGTTKLTGTGNTVQYFNAIGWGQWLRYLTSFVDVAAALLILVPRSTFYGALVLISSVGTATFLSFTVLAADRLWGGPPMKLIPLALTVLAAALAWLTRPQRVPGSPTVRPRLQKM